MGVASGAGTGATIGSFIPGVGTAIGAGVGALFGGLFGGGGDKKKDKAEEQAQTIEQMLQARSARQQVSGEQSVAQGKDALGDVLEYYAALTGTDPGAALEASKAERGRVIDQYDAARQAAAKFGPRGGGTTSAIASSRISQANQLSDILSTTRREGAAALAGVAGQLAALGLSEEQLASADLETVISSVLTRAGYDVERRGQTGAAWGAVGQAAGTILGSIFGGGGE